MDGKKFIEACDAAGLRTVEVDALGPDGDRVSTLIFAPDGRQLGGVDEDFTDDTAKTLARSIYNATEIDLDL